MTKFNFTANLLNPKTKPRQQPNFSLKLGGLVMLVFWVLGTAKSQQLSLPAFPQTELSQPQGSQAVNLQASNLFPTKQDKPLSAAFNQSLATEPQLASSPKQASGESLEQALTELKQSLEWRILFSFSLPEASLVNLFRLSIQYQIPLLLQGISLEPVEKAKPEPETYRQRKGDITQISFPLAKGFLGKAIQAQQRRIADLVAKYQLKQVPTVYLDPMPFRSLPQSKVPALVLQQVAGEPEPNLAALDLPKQPSNFSPHSYPTSSVKPKSAKLLYIQYGNLSLDLGEDYKHKLITRLTSQLRSHLVASSGSQAADSELTSAELPKPSLLLKRIVESWATEVVFNSQQLHEVAELELSQLLKRHAQALPLKLPSLSQGLAGQLARLEPSLQGLSKSWQQRLVASESDKTILSTKTSVYSASKPNLEGDKSFHDQDFTTASKPTTSWLPLLDLQTSQSQLIRNPYFSLADPNLKQPAKLDLLPQAFPLELWFLDVSNPALANRLALGAKRLDESDTLKQVSEVAVAKQTRELFFPQLQSFFASPQRVIILSNFSCPSGDYASCWQELQTKLGKQLFLASPELLEKFAPSALTRISQDPQQAKSLLIKHYSLASWQELLAREASNAENHAGVARTTLETSSGGSSD